MSKSAWAKVKVLTWADIIPYYVLWMLITYLTEVWHLNFTHAAGIVNLFYGIVALMPLGLQLIVDNFIGYYWMVLLSSFAYITGLGLLTLSTPPVLSAVTGNCSAYEYQCLGQVQKVLFYTAIPLIAVGMGGHLTSVEQFARHQLPPKKVENIDGVGIIQCICFCGMEVLFGNAIVGFAIGYIKSWWILFAIAGISSLAAVLTFLTGSRSYKIMPREVDNPFTTLVRVYVASICNIFRTHPGRDSLYEINDHEYKISSTARLRCLDRAAIIASTQSLEKQENNRWRLCRVTEVEEAKRILCMIPLCMNFILIGIISAVGNTYFVEQANHMNRKDSKLGPFPFFALVILHEYSKGLRSPMPMRSEKVPPYFPLGFAMVHAILCCITAAKVESRRLSVVISHGLLDKPNEGIPISRAWLIPQFMLLGTLNRAREDVFNSVLTEFEVPMLSRYRPLAHAVFGVGTISSVLSVYVVGLIKPSWFQDTLNRSRLDNYYWTLAALTAVNLVVYVILIRRHCSCSSFEFKESNDDSAGDDEVPVDLAPDPL